MTKGVFGLSVFDYVSLILFCIAVLTVVVFAFRTKKPLKTLLWSCIWGLSGLFALYFTYPLSGFRLELTAFTLVVSSVFGLPGVICMTLTKMLWGL